MQFREHCATSVKTMFSQSITQIPPFCDNSYTYQCGFSMPTKQFYFHWKRVETDDDILQILKMVENPSNSTHLEKNSSRALSSASSCNSFPFLPISSSFSFETRHISLTLIVHSRCASRNIYHVSSSLVVFCSFRSLRVIFLLSLVHDLNKIESCPVAIYLFYLRRNT